MSSPLRGLGVVAIAVGLTACAGTRAPAPSTMEPAPSSTASPSATTPSTSTSPSSAPDVSSSARVFASVRHGYRVEVPPGWVVNEYEGSWASLSQFSPGGEIPGEDAIAPPGFASFLVMNSMELPTAMTGQQWRSSLEALVSAGCPPIVRDPPLDTFAGETATILEQSCAGRTTRSRRSHAGARWARLLLHDDVAR